MADETAKRAWIERVLGFRIGDAVQGLDAASVSGRIKAARDRALKLPEPERYNGDLRAAILAVQQGDLATASSGLDRLEGVLASAERAREAAAEIARSTEGVNVGVVALAKLKLRWNALEASRELAISRLEQVLTDVLDAEFGDDPRKDQAEAAVARIAERVPQAGGDLRQALDDLAGTLDQAKRTAARGKAMKAIGDYRQSLGAEPMLQVLQNTEYGTYKIVDEIIASLDALEAVLAG